MYTLDWAVLSDEQMSNGWPFSLLNDEQMSNWLGVEHQPVENERLEPKNGGVWLRWFSFSIGWLLGEPAVTFSRGVFGPQKNLAEQWKKPGCLEYLRDYTTTQLYRGNIKPL